MKIDGGCHCGKISYQAEADPEKVLICHCSDCQKLSGTSFRTVLPVHQDNISFSGDTPKEYIKIGSSGAKRAQGFCGDCGSALYATSVGDQPRVYGMRVGTMTQAADLAPKTQKFKRDAMGWLGSINDLPGTETQ